MKLNKTNFAIQIKRGAAADVNEDATKYLALEGEPHWATDTQRLFIYSAVLSQMIGLAMYDSDGCIQFPVFTDATRPSAGTVGRAFFNSDDGQLNIDDGANWTLPDGTIT